MKQWGPPSAPRPPPAMRTLRAMEPPQSAEPPLATEPPDGDDRMATSGAMACGDPLAHCERRPHAGPLASGAPAG